MSLDSKRLLRFSCWTPLSWQNRPATPPRLRRPRSNTSLHRYSPKMSFFPLWEQTIPAGLLRLLLLMAGIEPNPGPEQWHCSVCAHHQSQANLRSLLRLSVVTFELLSTPEMAGMDQHLQWPCETRNPLRPSSAAANVQQFQHRKENLFRIKSTSMASRRQLMRC